MDWNGYMDRCGFCVGQLLLLHDPAVQVAVCTVLKYDVHVAFIAEARKDAQHVDVAAILTTRRRRNQCMQGWRSLWLDDWSSKEVTKMQKQRLRNIIPTSQTGRNTVITVARKKARVFRRVVIIIK